MTINGIPDPAGKILALLQDDTPVSEHYTPHVIERLPLNDVIALLGELGISLTMCSRVQELVAHGRKPAELLLSLLDSEEETDLTALERRPLSKVVAALDQLGANRAAGLERIREILDPETVEAIQASAAGDKSAAPEITQYLLEPPNGRFADRPRSANLAPRAQQPMHRTTSKAANGAD
ncbi:hypothetical protein, partial [Falsiroseomonas sp. E2-1-a20]|uniref:hypothetical protein n=1 Tax=Falsiroseomonas sp. E2-1-a20 TaxID=3239300 RepID=UPI003F31217D